MGSEPGALPTMHKRTSLLTLTPDATEKRNELLNSILKNASTGLTTRQ